MSLKTIQSNNDSIARSGSFIRGSASCVVSGLSIQQVPQSLELQVMPGEAVVNGCFYKLDSLYNNLVPPTTLAVVDGLQVLVCLKLHRTPALVLNRHQQQVMSNVDYTFSFIVVGISDYVYDPDILVLGSCRYSIMLRDTNIGSNQPVQLPSGSFGIYTDLPAANTSLFGTSDIDAFTDTSKVPADSTVIVSTDTGTSIAIGSTLTAYRWAPTPDPVAAQVRKLAMSLEDVRENLSTHATGSDFGAGAAFKAENQDHVCVTYNVWNTAYTISYAKPSGSVVSAPVDVTVHTLEFGIPVTVSGIITANPSTVVLDFEFIFPGDEFKHTVSLSWPDDLISTSLQSVSGMWSNVGGSQFLAFTYTMLGYALPWQRFTWEQVTPEFTEINLDVQYFYSIIGIIAELDETQNTYSFIRPMYSGTDTQHRSMATVFKSKNNPHGLGFADVGYGSMPLHKQLFDSGFGIAPMSTHGIVGTQFTEDVASENIKTDYFGNVTGVLCNRYIQLQHVPLNVASLVNANGSDVYYSILNDVVVLGPDFVGGDFRIYPVFSKTVSYAIGSRVVSTQAGVDVLYICIEPWAPNPAASDIPDPSFFQQQTRVDLTCKYFYLQDLEYSRASDTQLKFASNQSAPVITEGEVVEPQSTGQLIFNLGAYKNIKIPKMTLSLASDRSIVSTEQVLDTCDLSLRQASQPSFALQTTGACQVKVYLTNTPRRFQLAPLQGHLLVTSTAFHGRVRLFYTYGVNQVTVMTTNTQVSTFSGDLDLSSAQLFDGVNYIQRNSWEYSYETKQVIIASDVYVPGRIYRLVRLASESQRNQSGIIEVQGTRPSPEGLFAQAYIECLEYARLSIGDSVSITIPGKPTVTKRLQEASGYTGFIKGNSVLETLQSLAAALAIDPVFRASNSQAYFMPGDQTRLYINAGTSGAVGNTYTLSVDSVNTSLQSVAFSGGVDHVWSFDDLSGLAYTLNDVVAHDSSSYFSVWSTGSLDHKWDASSFYRVDIMPDSGTGSISRTLSEQSGAQVLSSSGWVLGFGWFGSYISGFNKTVSGTAALANNVTYKKGALYRVSCTLSSHVSGSLTISLAGAATLVERTSVFDIVALDATGLVCVPSSDFIGTVVVRVQYIADSYNASDEISLSLQITGNDSEGNTLQETLVLDASNFCDIQNPRIDNQYSNVRSKNLYSSVSSWSVLNAANTGSSQLTLIGESASGTRDLFDLCDLSWNGAGVGWIRDRRYFVDAYTNKPTSDTTAEALSTVAALLQFQMSST